MAEESNVKEKKNTTPINSNKYNFDFDELQMYFCEPYRVKLKNNKYIEIHQPSIGEILKIGDREVFSSIAPFTSNTTSYRVQLWDVGIDWNKITDYELFLTLAPMINNVEFLFKIINIVENPNYIAALSEEKNLTLGNEKYLTIYNDIDFSKLKQYVIKKDINKDQLEDQLETEEETEIILYDEEQEIVIDEETYVHIREYIRMMFNQYPKEEFAKGKLAKQWIIDEEKNKLKLESEKNNGKKKSVLLPMVSGLLNHPGFKYDLDGIKKIGIFAFMDCVRRLQIYEQCTAFMKGMYSGMMDTSSLGEDELNKRINWLQDVYEK